MKNVLIALTFLIARIAFSAPSDATIANNLSVGKDATFSGNFTLSGWANINNNLNMNNRNINYVTNAQIGTINSNVNVNGNVTMNGNINMNGNDLIDVDEIKRIAPATDTATLALYLLGQDALYNSSTNITGSDLILSVGSGRKIFTVANYLNCSTDVMTIYYTPLGGTRTAVTFTEGSSWTAATNNDTTAASLAAAIAANPLFTGTTSSGAIVYVKTESSKNKLGILTTGDATCTTATNSNNGNYYFTGPSLTLYFSGHASSNSYISVGTSSFTSSNAWVATTYLQAGAASYFSHNGRSEIYSSADGKHNLTNDAATGYTSLTLGLETNAFPSLIVDGAGIKFGLGDGTVGGTFTFPNTGLHLFDTNASHDLIVAPGSDLTADHTLTLTTGDADRTITLSGNPTLNDWFDQSVKAASTPTFAGAALNGNITNTGGDLATTASPIHTGYFNVVRIGADSFTADANYILHLNTSIAGGGARLEQTDAGAVGPVITLHHNSASPANDDAIGTINFNGEDASSNDTTYGIITTLIKDTTADSENGYMALKVIENASTTEYIGLDGLNATVVVSKATSFSDQNITNVGTVALDSVNADGTTVDYNDINIAEITQEDVGATCTLGQIRLDTGGSAKELCYCQATNTWYCWTATTLTGPTD